MSLVSHDGWPIEDEGHPYSPSPFVAGEEPGCVGVATSVVSPEFALNRRLDREMRGTQRIIAQKNGESAD